MWICFFNRNKFRDILEINIKIRPQIHDPSDWILLLWLCCIILVSIKKKCYYSNFSSTCSLSWKKILISAIVWWLKKCILNVIFQCLQKGLYFCTVYMYIFCWTYLTKIKLLLQSILLITFNVEEKCYGWNLAIWYQRNNLYLIDGKFDNCIFKIKYWTNHFHLILQPLGTKKYSEIINSFLFSIITKNEYSQVKFELWDSCISKQLFYN